MSTDGGPRDLLAGMRRAWSFTGRTPEARESMARLAAAYPELNLGAIATKLLCSILDFNESDVLARINNGDTVGA